ncbi:bifunctional Zinc finger [Babesia duncani]|uniref:Bifunctional Zinc finger n=1 Tax=Babesia duncani TaxID=323732 RepID=A0AAD9PMP2_9APIC|nr:bifunctional Zinc finger [Babesia duncani]
MIEADEATDECYVELYKLQKLYGCTFHISNLDANSPVEGSLALTEVIKYPNVVIKFILRPTDPDFDLSQLLPFDGILLKIALVRKICPISQIKKPTEELPNQSGNVESLHLASAEDIAIENENITTDIKNRIKRVIYGYTEKHCTTNKYVIYESLKFVDKYLRKIFQIVSHTKPVPDNEVVWSLQEQKSLEFALSRAKQITEPKEKWLFVANIVKTKNANECIRRFLRVRESIINKQQEPPPVPEYEPVFERNAPLRLVGLEVEAISVFTVINTMFQFSCSRCAENFDISLSFQEKKKTTFSKKCDKCNLTMSCEMMPKIAFNNQTEIFDVKLENCVFVDFINGDLSATCEQCDTVFTVRDVKIGLKKNGSCRGCFSKFSLTFDAIECGALEPHQVIQKAIRIVKREQKKSAVSQRFKVGTPLPNLGTCSHYQKSFRWFRFPCCGKMFPCDVCHNEKSDHANDLANIILCGHCSTQQAVSNKNCKNCGKGFTASNSSYWEVLFGGISLTR